MTKYAVGILIGLVMVAGLIIPIVNDAQSHAGERIIYNNDAQMTTYREAVPGDVLSIYRLADYDVWALNGTRVTGLDLPNTIAWNVAVMSDGLYVEYISHSNASIGSWRPMDESILNEKFYIGGTIYTAANPLNITFGSETITVVTINNTYTLPYTWAYVPCNLEDATYMASATSTEGGYVHSAEDVTLCGHYSSGDNDTTYYYHNGEGWNYHNFPMSVDVSLDKVEGTTDIYVAKSTVDMGGETFNPYRMLVPYEVVGHADSGAAYTLLGIVPLMAIVVLTVFAASAIRSRRY